MDSFLTVNEISKLLKVERDSVVRWIRTGRLRAFKPGNGRFWRVKRADFQAFVRGGADFREKYNS